MGNAKINNFTDLKVWQEAHKLVLVIYKITENFPKHEQFGLVSQIRRAVVSITSNIAEGFSRATLKDKLKFYVMAHGSLTEVENQLIIARDLLYLDKTNYETISEQLLYTHKILNSFIRSTNALAINSPSF
ncbi:MAG: four helix bundle protein [Candidatus Doudnabacteria bacterium]|nr:four helix bundle protein [Candidatus Doudnabacteria bacterium]